MSTDPVAAESRPRERKSDKTRRRILDAAAEILNRDGFAGVRLSDIAARAEVRVPGLYYYFDSREAILEEVVIIGTRLTMANVEAKLAQLPANASALDRICTAFGAHLEMVLKESAYTAAAMRTMGQLPGDIRDRQLHEHRIYGELWRGLIAAGVESGDVDPALDPRAARMFLLGAVNWAPEWFDPERGSIDQAVATIELLVRKALSNSAGALPTGPKRRDHGDLTPLFVPPVR